MTSGSVVFSQEGVSLPSRTYSYCSRPRAVPARMRYRTTTTPEISDQEVPVRYGNLMYDRRVVRGNTYGLHPLPWSSEPDVVEMQKRREAHRKMLARQRERDELNTEIYGPQIIESKFRVNVQTELYLEEIADRIREVDIECQTDEFMERPPTPLFIPAKVGVDIATQIEFGELFDFDVEIKPVLEVLVGKSIEQALLEVMEEEDLANLRAYQNGYLELRNAELAEVQRLEEQERRHKQEKERRMMVQYDRKEAEKEVTEKVAARSFAVGFLKDLIPSAIRHLQSSGFFYDTTEREIEDGFLPYLLNKVQANVMKKVLGRDMVESIVKRVTAKRFRTFQEYENFRRRQKQDPFKVYESISIQAARKSSSTTVPGEIRQGKLQKTKSKHR